MELLAKLGIDWRLLIAQIVNFTILLTVLTFFVYNPLLRLIDERRERIRKSMDDAEKIARHKEDLKLMREKALKDIDQECGATLEKAKTDAEHMRTEIIKHAEMEAKNILKKGQDQLRHERHQALEDTQKMLTKNLVTLTENILAREFSPNDQKRILDTLERSLPSLLP